MTEPFTDIELAAMWERATTKTFLDLVEHYKDLRERNTQLEIFNLVLSRDVQCLEEGPTHDEWWGWLRSSQKRNADLTAALKRLRDATKKEMEAEFYGWNFKELGASIAEADRLTGEGS